MYAIQSPLNRGQQTRGRPKGSKNTLSISQLLDNIEVKMGMTFAEAFVELLQESRSDFLTIDEKGKRLDNITYPKLMMSTMARVVEMPKTEINLTSQVSEMSDDELQRMAKELAIQIVSDNQDTSITVSESE